MKKKYQNEKVSVIIPIYNAEKYITSTINSILGQTYRDFEIIVIDDCSTDSSKECVKRLCESHPNIIYRLQEKNAGVAVARNMGLDIASGRYVAFLDSDDEWKKEKLEKQIRYMHSQGAGFVFSAIEMVDEEGKLIRSKRKVKEKVSYQYLLKNTVIPTSSVVIDRNKVLDFRMPLMRSGQDYATWLMILRTGIVAYGIDEALVKYRVARGSLSSNKLKSIKQVWEIQVKQEKIPPFIAGYNTCWFVWNALKKYLLR